MLNLGGFKNYSMTISAGQTDFSLSPAIGALQYFEVMDLYVTVDAAGPAAGTGARIGFGAASVPAAGTSSGSPATGMVLDHPGILPGAIVPGIPGKGAAGEELRGTFEAPTGGSLVITFLGAIRSSV